MPGNSPQQAFKNFLEPLKRTLKCLGQDAKWVHGDEIRLGGYVALALANPIVVRSSLYAGGLSLDSQIAVDIIHDPGPSGEYRCTTRSYLHSIRSGGEQLLAFHWHPQSNSPEIGPHLHFGKSVMPQDGTIHIPCSRTTLESVVRMMLVNLGATTKVPKDGPNGWLEVLNKVEGKHTEYRTWESYQEGRIRWSPVES